MPKGSNQVMKKWKVVLTVFISAILCGCGNSGAIFNGNKVGTDDTYEPEVIVEESDDYTHVIDRVLNEYNFTPVEWGTTIDNSQDALISLAEDSTGRYKAYGIISKEKGCYGIILNDTIDGTDSNTNYAYEEWIYTEYEGDKPDFTWKDDKLYLTYPVAGEDLIIPKTVHIDCGYDTGHMEIDVNADSN